MSGIEVADTSVKIGLGALIAGIFALVSARINQGYRSFVLNSFIHNANNLEKAIIFRAIAESTATPVFSLEEIDVLFKRQGKEISLSQLDQSLDNLKLIRIIKQRGKQYSLTSNVFYQMLVGNYDVGYVLKKIFSSENL